MADDMEPRCVFSVDGRSASGLALVRWYVGLGGGGQALLSVSPLDGIITEFMTALIGQSHMSYVLCLLAALPCIMHEGAVDSPLPRPLGLFL